MLKIETYKTISLGNGTEIERSQRISYEIMKGGRRMET